MKILWLLLLIPLFGIQAMSQSFKCLPNDVKPDEIANTSTIADSTGQPAVVKTTVVQAIKKLRGRCRSGKLVDPRGRQFRFHRTQGCWGNPPADYQEILEKQRKEIADLKKKYTLIEITCNPSGLPIG